MCIELEIPGNSVADCQANGAAKDGRQQKYENPDKGLASWDVQHSIMREAARLVHDIGHKFPRNPKNGPAASKPCAVAPRAKPLMSLK